ncbi:nif-specific transcriptional activator NifA [Halorhodospira halophila]|uniref:Nif-specific regulatory protein n=1 Tax=Halorhodospira halophila (strain DSM 244 / SL1) TaxID=349124 RepID=A1WTR4_HALHL|nr:nif-specific transcriptional activator NifA [Halorhodospira halophila]ABM61076.1 transcriptional regulator, NifA, Fis Family [Halorhodospira halophila SL1]MBK1729793.1 nif-specific transcriptional activator NifA [Halorhodospira halophila]
MENPMPVGPRERARAELVEAQLEALYQVSRVLSRSLDLRDTLQAVLEVLHEHADMHSGMVALRDPVRRETIVRALHGQTPSNEVIYRPGEGIVGEILNQAEPLIVRRISAEPRFLDRLGLYDPDLPFIGVPINGPGEHDPPVGVLAAQPAADEGALLAERSRFMQMVANLVAQTVRLATEVEREQAAIVDERDRLRREVQESYGFENVIGRTPAIRRVFEQVRRVAQWSTTVLLRGESGTGKELLANAIHYNSPRADAPFVKLNCAALPDSLLESELFGHEKGAFTGAVQSRVGRFEQADGGTIFLDEMGEISPAFQAKLLRILQEGEFERVGSTRTRHVDVRVLAATNRDLEAAVAAGEFREDLYYRLNVMAITMPALRERLEDVPELARFLVGRIADVQQRALDISDDAIRTLMRYHWPGNVRELQNALERAAIMSEDGHIDHEALLLAGIPEDGSGPAGNGVLPAGPAAPDPNDPALDERERVIAALERTGWVQAKAARLLGMTPRQIAYRIKTLDIPVKSL